MSIEEVIMTIRIVRLGTKRIPNEGLRIGTVRRPPRGVPKNEYSAQNWYDVWFPNLSPSPQTLKLGQAATTPSEWKTFFRKYRAEMTTPENGKTLDLLAALSHETNFPWAVIAPTKRTVTDLTLRALLLERGAKVE